MVKYNGLTKAEVLCALYNNSKPQGLGVFVYQHRELTLQVAEMMLKERTIFDYIQGRVIKVDLSEDDGFEEWLYDRDNGEGAAQKALDDYLTEKNNVSNV